MGITGYDVDPWVCAAIEPANNAVGDGAKDCNNVDVQEQIAQNSPCASGNSGSQTLLLRLENGEFFYLNSTRETAFR